MPSTGIAVAKNSGMPGTMYSGAFTYGKTVSVGCLVQALTPASASDAPISLMKERRPTGSSRCGV